MKDRREVLRSAVAGTALTALFSENGFAETAGTHISKPAGGITSSSQPNSGLHGEFEAARASDATCKFLDTKGFEGTTFPALNQPVYGQKGFRIRPGGHHVTNFDWIQFLNFSNLHFGK